MKGKFPLLPRRKNTDKSAYGHALVVGGSDEMPGAAILASRAALVSGAGLVTLASTARVTTLAAPRNPELLLKPLASRAGSLLASSAGGILRYAEKRRVNAAVVGPGLSTRGDAVRLARNLARNFAVPFVLDADGLNAFRGRAADLKKRMSPAVLTPHAREFERVFGEPAPEAPPARRRLVKRLAAAYDIVLVLKGHRTLVSDGRRVYENRTGGPALAKGGSGDVLAGMAAAFLAQKLKPFEAACWAVYLHGKAGDRAARRSSELSVTATMLLVELPGALRSA
ncbi:MAG TPA: NAD(P)H-hydrate dehydratase [Candidatus Eisenbacteria bacterium]|nr:NAD(P)H-hydrate dehydratase [Candidatus Eisenbacteria bacterium]